MKICIHLNLLKRPRIDFKAVIDNRAFSIGNVLLRYLLKKGCLSLSSDVALGQPSFLLFLVLGSAPQSEVTFFLFARPGLGVGSAQMILVAPTTMTLRRAKPQRDLLSSSPDSTV